LCVQCYSLSTSSFIFFCMNAITLFFVSLLPPWFYMFIIYIFVRDKIFYDKIVPIRATILSVHYWCVLTACLLSTILLWNILQYCTHESHNIVCWLLVYADNNVRWVLYCYEICYDIVPMIATILSVDYWHMLTIMSVEYYIAMKYFTILYPWEPQYCLLTKYWCMLTIMSVEYCCYEIFYDIVSMRATILSVDYWRMLTIMSVEYYIAMKYITFAIL